MDMQGSGYGSPWQTPPGDMSGMGGLGGLAGMGGLAELGELGETGFEPQTRARSNTWPLPRPENYVDPPEDAGSNKCSTHQLSGMGGMAVPSPASVAASKKNSSRRNAWGNLSYADLITQAITSSQDSRLTLSQIYEWMVQNVPYFKDKGDSNSSAGWKNSIRHNLSLHNRFMRVQNEGTGKSSWWMINPDAKPGKSVRRRAASMETSKYEKRRGRAKKKVESLRSGLPADATPSPSSSISEGLDMFPDSPLHSGNNTGGFQPSPDFRQRASSNASSCGRLSPIQSVFGGETDWGSQDYPPAAGADQLAGSLADSMNLQGNDSYLNSFSGGLATGPAGPPPPYPAGAGYGRGFLSLSCTIHGRQPCACMHRPMHHTESMSPSSVTGMSPSYPAEACGAAYIRARPPSCSPPRTPHTPGALLPPPHRSDMLQQHHSNVSQVGHESPLLNGALLSSQHDHLTPASTMMGQLMGALNNTALLDDLNINIETLEHGGFDCNVDEVIKHELSMDGSLDFNFPQQQQQQQQNQQQIQHQQHIQQQQQQHQQHQQQNQQTQQIAYHNNLPSGGASVTEDSLVPQQRPPAYSVAPSWVH